MIRGLHLELLIWIAALIILAFTNPHNHHFSLCPISNLGFNWCPGCGLGRSVAFILQGNLYASFDQHWFGIPAFLILVYRILQLSSKFILPLKAI